MISIHRSASAPSLSMPHQEQQPDREGSGSVSAVPVHKYLAESPKQKVGHQEPIIERSPQVLQEPSESKAISLQESEHIETARYKYWTQLDCRFSSIISKEDFFQLTGEDKGVEIITINGVEYPVMPHGHLKKGQIMISSAHQELRGQKLTATACKKKQKNHSKIIAKVRIPEQKNLPVCPGNITHAIRTAMNCQPIQEGRQYKLQLAIRSTGKNKPLYWYDAFVTMHLPEKQPDTDKPEKSNNEDEPTQTLNVCMAKSGRSQDIECHVQAMDDSITFVHDEPPVEKTLRVKPLVGSSTTNKIGLNMHQVRAMNPKLTHGAPLKFLVKLNDSHVYATADEERDETKRTHVRVNAAQSLKPGEEFIMKLVHEVPPPAAHCSIHLTWHRYFVKAHGLDQNAIGELTRKALEDVPLERDKKFLVVVHGENNKPLCALEGTVTDVSGEESESLPGVFCYDKQTRITLDSSDPAILDGSQEPRGRTTEEVVKVLSEGLGGVSEIAEKIAKDVILPFGKEHGERGILLCGPAGVGKSALSRNVGTALYALDSNIHYISPASVMEETAAKSAETLEKEITHALSGSQGEPVVIVFDEIDTMLLPESPFQNPSDVQQAICKSLQTLMDKGSGESPRNLIIIGTTNKSVSRFSEAFRRPNRFSVALTMDLPNEQQRLEILSSAVSKHATPGISIKPSLLNYLAQVTANQSGAELARIVKQIVVEAGNSVRECPGAKPEITKELIDGVLFNPVDIAAHKKKALSLVPGEDNAVLTSSEQKAIEKTLSVLGKVIKRPGNRALIYAPAKSGARTSLLCRKVLESSEGFSYVDVVPRGSNMFAKAENAMDKAAKNIRSLVVIDGADRLIGQGSSFKDPKLIGDKWNQITQNKHKNMALVVTAVHPDGIDEGNAITQTMGLDHCTAKVPLAAKLTRSAMNEIMAKKYPQSTNEQREEVFECIESSEADINAGYFGELIDFHCNESDDSLSWDIEAMKEEVELNKSEPSYLYS